MTNLQGVVNEHAHRAHHGTRKRSSDASGRKKGALAGALWHELLAHQAEKFFSANSQFTSFQ